MFAYKRLMLTVFFMGLTASLGVSNPSAQQNYSGVTTGPVQAPTSPCANGKESGLPLPSSFQIGRAHV